MPVRKRLFSRLLLLSISTVTASAWLFAAEGDIHQLLDTSNLRKGPDSSYEAVATAESGDKATELARKGDWTKVRLNSGESGWVYSPSLKKVSKAEGSRQAREIIVAESTAKHHTSGSAAVNELFELNDYGVVKQAEPIDTGKHVVVSAGTPVVEKTSSVSEAFELNGLAQQPIQLIEQHAVDKAVDMPVQAVEVEKSAKVEAAAIDTPARLSGAGSVTEVFELNGYGVLDQEATAAKAAEQKAAQIKAEEQRVAEAKTAELKAAQIKAEEQRVAEAKTAELKAAQIKAEEQRVAAAKAAELKAAQIKAEEQRVAAAKAAEQKAVGKQNDLVLFDTLLPDDSSQSLDTNPAQSFTIGAGQQLNKTTTIRTGPGSLYDVLGWGGNGAGIVVLEQKGDWLKVRMLKSERVGWVEASSVATKRVREDAALSTAVEVPIKKTKIDPVPVKPVDAGKAVSEPSLLAVEKPESVLPGPVPREGKLIRFTRKSSLRAGPGAKYDVVSWAAVNVYATTMDAKGDWRRIQMQESGRIGWVHKGSIALEHTRPATTTASAPAAYPIKTVEIRADESAPEVMPVQQQSRALPVHEAQEGNLLQFTRKANLRAGPDAKYDVVTWAGTDSYATELGNNGDWLRVRMQQSKRIGWVFKSSIQLVKAGVQAAATVQTLPATTVIAAASAAPSVVVSAISDSPVEAVKLNPVQGDRKTDQLYFFKQTSNLRAGPGKKYDVVAWGARNESTSEIARKGDWSRVSMTLSNKVGWVLSSALIPVEATPVVATADPLPVGRVEAGHGELYEVVKTSTLRTESRQEAEMNSWVAKGDQVSLLQRQNGWARVNPQVDGKPVGWIKTDLLRAVVPAGQAVSGEHMIGKHNVDQYRNRVSHGEAFNFSYAALEQALYRIPIEEFYINMDRDDLESIFRKEIYDRSTFDIEMKTKGHALDKTLLGTANVLGSSTRVFAKKSLLIKLDKEGGRWYGQRRIALRSMASDKAMMREWMAWKLMAALGMKVPEVHFVRVNFNQGQRVGLYLSIEWMGTNFLAANHMDTKGEFYQPEDAEYCGDLNSTDRLDICFNKITPQDGDYSTLKRMAEAVSGASVADMHKVLAKQFDDESVLNWIAVNALVTDGDTYNKNYWLYRDPTVNKWTVIPWDYNLTFGRTYDPFVENPYKTFNDNFQYYYPPDVGASNPLKDLTLRNPHLRHRLQQKIRHLLGLEPNGPESTYGWFSPTVMHARIGNLASVVGKELYRDNFIVYGEEDFRKSYESLMYYVTAHANFLDKKLFGKYKWTPVDPKAPPVFDAPLPSELYGQGFINAGADSLYMTDEGWGLLVGQLVLDHPVVSRAEVKMNIEGGRSPKYLPTAQAASRCIQRSWLLSVESGVSTTADLMVEYIQENSRRSEVPVTVREDQLELWMYDGNRWKPLKTEVNEYANTLTARGVPIKSGRLQRFVACSPF